MSEPWAPGEDAHALIGAYVLDALDDDERSAFQRHLAACPDCQAELPGLAAAAARVGASAYVAPPHRMKAAVLERVGRTRQLPPTVPAPLRASQRGRPRRVLAACAAVVALATAGTAVGLGVAYQHERSRAAQLSALIAHPQRSAYAQVPGGGVLLVSIAHGRAAVRMAGVPTPPPQRTYELWVVPENGRPRPAGLMRGGGNALIDSVTGAKALAVSVEPVAGSAAPTTAPLVVVPV